MPSMVTAMNYNHALFLNPYIESSDNGAMRLFPPVGLEYVAASAKEFARRITVIDLRHEKELCVTENLLAFIREEKIDLVCVSITWDRQFDEICDLLNRIPDHIPVIVGGYKATELAVELLQRCPTVDAVVRGEGEETIKEIMGNVPFEDIKGISFRHNGEIRHNPFRPFPAADTIPAPDRSLRRYKYRMTFGGINVTNLTFDSVLTARGCPFNCKFCTFNLNPLGQKRKYSERDIASVVDEIEASCAGAILFGDDEIFANKKRAEKLCDEIIRRKIRKRFIAQTRIDIAKHPQLLDKIVKAGFKALLVGIESPHDWVLGQFNKGFDSNTIREAFAVLRKYPIYFHGYFIYGNIGETEEEMLYIPEFAKEIGVDGVTLNKLRIEKFSALREIAEKTPGYHITEKGELYSDRYSHAALKKIGRRMRKMFYTPSRFPKMLYKVVFKAKFFTFWETVQLVLTAPLLIFAALSKEMQKRRFAKK
ncbi:MAG: B12-binding domain-containing radical SAM protein [Candidatus Omnitrophica bacterium]|nr:B12-binding domain-containing radical SAM protein [Candidatus Omnitrophota bacterium]